MNFSEDEKAATSIRIFRKFIIKEQEDRITGKVHLNAEGVVSKECYDLWINTRKTLPSCPQKSFQRALSSHVCGVDGRHPFDADEEEAILKVIRRKQKWPCFLEEKIRFGLNGFRARGFHEKAVESPNVRMSTEWKAKRRSDIVKHNEEKSKRLRMLFQMNDGNGSGSSQEEGSSPSSSSPSYGDEDEEEEDIQMSEETESTTSSDWSSTSHHQLIDNSSNIITTNNNHIMTTTMATTTQNKNVEEQEEEEPDSALEGFAKRVNKLMDRVRSVGGKVGSWESILKSLRYNLLSLGFFETADISLIEVEYKTICENYPEQGVLVIDPLAKVVKDRILFCNALAEKRFGKITPEHGGVKRTLCPDYENWPFLQWTASMWYSPGKEIEHDFDLIQQDGEIKRVRCWAKFHPELRVCFLRGYIDVI